MSRKIVQFNAFETQSGLNRIKNAEGLILQLPQNHDGRNTWLLNYGVGKEAEALREKHSFQWDVRTTSAESRNKQLARQRGD